MPLRGWPCSTRAAKLPGRCPVQPGQELSALAHAFAACAQPEFLPTTSTYSVLLRLLDVQALEGGLSGCGLASHLYRHARGVFVVCGTAKQRTEQPDRGVRGDA